MSYIEKFLSQGEDLRFRARLHWILWARAIAALVFLGIILIGVWIFVRQVIFLRTTELAVTDRRLILKMGLMERRVRDIGLDNIESVRIDQDILGRLFNYGRLTVRGTGDEVWSTPIIADPSGFRRDIETATYNRDIPASQTPPAQA